MAHPLPLTETLLLRYLLGLLLQGNLGTLHYRRAGRVLSTSCPMASWQRRPIRPTVIHAFQRETLIVTTPATFSLGIGHPLDLVCCKNCHGNNPQVYCVHDVTHRRDHQRRSAVILHSQQAHLQGPGVSFLVSLPSSLLPHARPSQSRVR